MSDKGTNVSRDKVRTEFKRLINLYKAIHAEVDKDPWKVWQLDYFGMSPEEALGFVLKGFFTREACVWKKFVRK